MASESANQARSFWTYFISSIIFFSLVVTVVATYKEYFDDTADRQSIVSAPELTNPDNAESVPLHSGPVVRNAGDNSYETRFRKLEARLTETQEASLARSRQLEMWLGKTQNAYEARFEQLEQHMASGGKPDNITTGDNPFPAAGVNDTGLTRTNARANQNREPIESRLARLEQGLHQAQEMSKNIFRQLERGDNRVDDRYESRLQSVEQQLGMTVAEFRDGLKKIEHGLINTASRIDDLSSAISAQAEHKETIAAINKKTATSPPAARDTGYTSKSRLPVSADPAGEDMPPAGQAHTTEDPGILAPGDRGNWAINLASYTSRSVAEKKMAEFRNKGVHARMTSAIVRGKLMYRLQVVGFESFAAAMSAAPSVTQRLNLGDAWIIRL
jgi:hypothetical protein